MVFGHTAEFNLPHCYLITGLLGAPGCHNAYEVRARPTMNHSSTSSCRRGGDPDGGVVKAWSNTLPAAA